MSAHSLKIGLPPPGPEPPGGAGRSGRFKGPGRPPDSGWVSRLRTALLWLSLAPLLGAVGTASEVCEAPANPDPNANPNGPVSLMILKSPAKVRALAASLGRGVPVVSSSTRTVIFRDGRVITADVEEAGQRLNALGWSKRPVRVVASFANRRKGPARSRG